MMPMVRAFRGKPLNRRWGRTFREGSVTDLPERVGYTVMFLRMTATEMLELADDNPEIAHELGRIADQVQAEAAELAVHIAE